MFKKYILISFLLTCLNSFSQEIVKEFDMKLEKKRDYFQVINEADKEVILFLNDKEKVSSIRFDDKFNVKDSLSTTRPEKNYKEIVGYSQNEGNYFLFWASEDRKEIDVQYFNFIKKETNTTPINLELKKEKIIKELTINNTFYLITIVKNTNILKFYISDNNGNLNEKIVDLADLEFKNSSNQKVLLYNAIIGGDTFKPTINIEHISNDSQPSLALSSALFKVYTYKKDEIIFTFDSNAFSTDILKINLNNFTADLKSIQQPEIAQQEYYYYDVAKSNSFLIDDKILQIKTTPDVLFFTVSDQNGNRINQFKTLLEEEINYKNSDVFQEIKSIHNKKVLEKPKQFIRKINNSSPAVTCYSRNGLYYTVIGSSQNIAHSGGGGMGMGGGFGGAPMSLGFTSSYTIGNLISYKDKNVVYTNCLFDSNFNHIEDKVQTSAFEKARLFLEENEDLKETTSIFGKDLYQDLIVFKFNSLLYLGNYNKQNKKYQIYSFTE